MFFGKKPFLGLAFVLLILAPVFGGQACATLHEVSIIDNEFVPQSDTIQGGDDVRWTNNGSALHTSTSNTGIWDSGTLNPGESFTLQFSTPGSFPYFCSFHQGMTGTIVVQSTEVKDETGSRAVPSRFALLQNYPNPFNQTTEIEFAVAKPGLVSLAVYDILGRGVRTLVSEHLSAGYKSVLWDGKNDAGKDVASGVYFYRLRSGDFSKLNRLVLLK